MKKIVLSGALIILFILYGLHQQQEGSSAAALVVANTPLASPSPSQTPSPSPSATPEATATTSDTPTPEPTATPTPAPTPPAGKYRNGTYTGSVADAFYGNIQVQAIVSGGKLTAVSFLQYPNDRSESLDINRQAMPLLQQEAIQAQSAEVSGVSGASDTSAAFVQSLSDALSQAS